MLLRLSAPVRDLYKPYRLTRDAPSSSMAQVCPATRAVDGLSERDRRGRIPLRDRVWLTLALWPRRAVRLAQWLPGELEDVDKDLGAPPSGDRRTSPSTAQTVVFNQRYRSSSERWVMLPTSWLGPPSTARRYPCHANRMVAPSSVSNAPRKSGTSVPSVRTRG
jgi:hypothetical protein